MMWGDCRPGPDCGLFVAGRARAAEPHIDTAPRPFGPLLYGSFSVSADCGEAGVVQAERSPAYGVPKAVVPVTSCFLVPSCGGPPVWGPVARPGGAKEGGSGT